MTDDLALQLAARSDDPLMRYLAKRLAELRVNVQQLSSARPQAALLPTPASMLFDVSDVDVVDFSEPRTITRREP